MSITTPIGSPQRPGGTVSSAKPHGVQDSAERATAKTGAAPQSSESVTLTATAQSMKVAQENATEAPFDEATVEKIKSAIAEGRYPIDNERVADSMLSYERLLLA
ncbi:flagellar biosynthesis anti-sigma factor FlgM [Thiorhodococcus mannitoliphagus]|uniref:Negative regulator of flagellin synthesis n=1 Tax=Thiorhodococcus mannitoliphagus TaxID=329406 RepID=A0A6P1DSL3_9GAMM|nr:flagellar biosynthesis anti-sigma factor FlgM [Thiorhodococcus mannitoliphagus]NEX21078.1 flagellar biosynthesis anti-sigma factor FlgM [Thiorhodococcus mannitoliphagus]